MCCSHVGAVATAALRTYLAGYYSVDSEAHQKQLRCPPSWFTVARSKASAVHEVATLPMIRVLLPRQASFRL